MSPLPYDPKPEQVVKLLETLERLYDTLNPGVMTEERKLMELSSKINDKLFVEWTRDANLFARMHSYGSLKDLMKERTHLSVDFKHLAAYRGSAFGRTASSGYQEKQRNKGGTPLSLEEHCLEVQLPSRTSPNSSPDATG